jgi:hypothetical protein
MPITDLDARILAATDRIHERTPARIAELAGCKPDVTQSALRRLRGQMLVEVDGSRPAKWLRTRHGDAALEVQP